MKNIRETAFNLVCIVFSLATLLLCLASSVKLADVNQTAAELGAMVEKLETENQILSAEAENMVDIFQLEEYAVNVLGMQSCSPEQIEYLIHPDVG